MTDRSIVELQEPGLDGIPLAALTAPFTRPVTLRQWPGPRHKTDLLSAACVRLWGVVPSPGGTAHLTVKHGLVFDWPSRNTVYMKAGALKSRHIRATYVVYNAHTLLPSTYYVCTFCVNGEKDKKTKWREETGGLLFGFDR